VLVAVPAVASADGSVAADARAHFDAGVAFLEDPDGARVEEAYREFRAAYDISHSPKVLGNLGLCAMTLERDGEAIESYTRYLREVTDLAPDERAQISRDLATLSTSAAHVVVTIDQPGVTILDSRLPVRGAAITNVYGPVDGRIELVVRSGHHQLRAKNGAFEYPLWEIDLNAGGKVEHAFRQAPEVVPSRPSRTLPLVATGAGVAMLAAGAITGLVAVNKTHAIESNCPNNGCPTSYDLEDGLNSARSFVRATDILLVGGGIVAAGGLTWFLLSGRGNTATTATTAICGPGSCMGSFRYRF
jgi:hypothetical protein